MAAIDRAAYAAKLDTLRQMAAGQGVLPSASQQPAQDYTADPYATLATQTAQGSGDTNASDLTSSEAQLPDYSQVVTNDYQAPTMPTQQYGGFQTDTEFQNAVKAAAGHIQGMDASTKLQAALEASRPAAATQAQMQHSAPAVLGDVFAARNRATRPEVGAPAAPTATPMRTVPNIPIGTSHPLDTTYYSSTTAPAGQTSMAPRPASLVPEFARGYTATSATPYNDLVFHPQSVLDYQRLAANHAAEVAKAAPVLAAYQAAQDPANLYQYAQQAAIEGYGANPQVAAGEFDPTWALEQAGAQPAAFNAYQKAALEAQERQANAQAGLGPYTNDELALEASHQAGLQPSAVQQIMDSAHVNLTDAIGIAHSQEYVDTMANVRALLADPNATDASVQKAVAAKVASGEVSPEVALAVLSYFGPIIPATVPLNPLQQALVAKTGG